MRFIVSWQLANISVSSCNGGLTKDVVVFGSVPRIQQVVDAANASLVAPHSFLDFDVVIGCANVQVHELCNQDVEKRSNSRRTRRTHDPIFNVTALSVKTPVRMKLS